MPCCGREEERQGSCVQKIFICEMLSSRGFLISATKSRERNSLKDIKLLVTWNHLTPNNFNVLCGPCLICHSEETQAVSFL